jgi:hypothetical protein
MTYQGTVAYEVLTTKLLLCCCVGVILQRLDAQVLDVRVGLMLLSLARFGLSGCAALCDGVRGVAISSDGHEGTIPLDLPCLEQSPTLHWSG